MPKIADIAGATLFVFPNDHPPPHIHARFERQTICLRISDAELLEPARGFPPRVLRDVRTWLLRNRDTAALTWAKYHA